MRCRRISVPNNANIYTIHERNILHHFKQKYIDLSDVKHEEGKMNSFQLFRIKEFENNLLINSFTQG